MKERSHKTNKRIISVMLIVAAAAFLLFFSSCGAMKKHITKKSSLSTTETKTESKTESNTEKISEITIAEVDISKSIIDDITIELLPINHTLPVQLTTPKGVYIFDNTVPIIRKTATETTTETTTEIKQQENEKIISLESKKEAETIKTKSSDVETIKTRDPIPGYVYLIFGAITAVIILASKLIRKHHEKNSHI